MRAIPLFCRWHIGQRVIVTAGMLCFAGVIDAASISADPSLNPAIVKTNDTIVASWFAVNAITYQMESSSNLVDWKRAGPAIEGRGTTVAFTSSAAGQNSTFYRIGRVVPANNTAVFAPATGLLTVVGDDLDNVIVVSRDAAGTILVNNGAMPITGGSATVANTVLIQIFGRAGNDQISLSEVNGALPPAQLFGESGNDTLTGGSGDDLLAGGDGNDTLLGKGGADTLFGGDGADALTGGDGNDLLDGGAGNDRFIWNPGDDTDVVAGGSGVDVVEINGGNGSENFTVSANGNRVRFERVTPAPFFIDIGGCEKLVLNANGGNDTLSCSGELASLIQIVADGGPGDDILLGSNGDDVLIGGDNNDFISGGPGNDTILLGNGDDVFQWNPGDGNDTVNGEAGNDTLVYSGNADDEILDLSADGSQLRLTSNVGNAVLDVAGVETVQVQGLGGSDLLTVNDLSGTGVVGVTLDLSAITGSGDGRPDTVVVNATEAADSVTVDGAAGTVRVTGLATTVTIFGSDPLNDHLTVNGLNGDDAVQASGLAAGIIGFTADGGAGADVIVGSAGSDTLLGGPDDDVLIGGPGSDVLDGGPGDNVLIPD